jgi:hypothetical protein
MIYQNHLIKSTETIKKISEIQRGEGIRSVEIRIIELTDGRNRSGVPLKGMKTTPNRKDPYGIEGEVCLIYENYRFECLKGIIALNAMLISASAIPS